MVHEVVVFIALELLLEGYTHSNYIPEYLLPGRVRGYQNVSIMLNMGH